jgi:hypothetical protein
MTFSDLLAGIQSARDDAELTTRAKAALAAKAKLSAEEYEALVKAGRQRRADLAQLPLLAPSAPRPAAVPPATASQQMFDQAEAKKNPAARPQVPPSRSSAAEGDEAGAAGKSSSTPAPGQLPRSSSPSSTSSTPGSSSPTAQPSAPPAPTSPASSRPPREGAPFPTTTSSARSPASSKSSSPSIASSSTTPGEPPKETPPAASSSPSSLDEEESRSPQAADPPAPEWTYKGAWKGRGAPGGEAMRPDLRPKASEPSDPPAPEYDAAVAEDYWRSRILACENLAQAEATRREMRRNHFVSAELAAALEVALQVREGELGEQPSKVKEALAKAKVTGPGGVPRPNPHAISARAKAVIDLVSVAPDWARYQKLMEESLRLGASKTPWTWEEKVAIDEAFAARHAVLTKADKVLAEIREPR